MNAKQRSALRARAHALNPVVIVGGEGLSAPVLSEIERNLLAHELIKVRVADGDREAREAAMRSICDGTGAEPVQHIGKILVVYRPAPPEEPKIRREPRKAAPKKPTKRREVRPAKRPAQRNAARGARRSR
jgi:RNA-binding protein